MSTQAAISGAKAREAAGAELDGLKQCKNGKVSDEEYQALLQNYEYTCQELAVACEERDKAGKLFLEYQNVSKKVIAQLEQNNKILQAKLQKEASKYEQACQEKLAAVKEVHMRYEEQMSALKADGASMRQAINRLQQQLSEQENRAKETETDLRDQLAAREQEICCYKQELAAVKAENKALKELNNDVQALVAQAKTDISILMKMLSAAQQATGNVSNSCSSNRFSIGINTDDLGPQIDNQQQQQQPPAASPQITLTINIEAPASEDLTAQAAALQAELISLQQNNMQLAIALDCNRTALLQAQEQLTAARWELQAVKASSSRAQQQVVQQHADVNNAVVVAAAAIKSLSAVCVAGSSSSSSSSGSDDNPDNSSSSSSSGSDDNPDNSSSSSRCVSQPGTPDTPQLSAQSSFATSRSSSSNSSDGSGVDSSSSSSSSCGGEGACGTTKSALLLLSTTLPVVGVMKARHRAPLQRFKRCLMGCCKLAARSLRIIGSNSSSSSKR